MGSLFALPQRVDSLGWDVETNRQGLCPADNQATVYAHLQSWLTALECLGKREGCFQNAIRTTNFMEVILIYAETNLPGKL